MLTKYRPSTYRLAIETGWYKQFWLTAEQTVSKQCNSNATETELLFLTEYKKY